MGRLQDAIWSWAMLRLVRCEQGCARKEAGTVRWLLPNNAELEVQLSKRAGRSKTDQNETEYRNQVTARAMELKISRMIVLHTPVNF